MAQALETLLSGWETSCSRAFREEQRCWRAEDLAWRTLRRAHEDLKLSQRELFRQWRAYNVEQQVLNNCRVLWDRYVQKNRRDVEEAVEMLKCLAQLGALTAGFAVSAFYDFQYTASSDNPVLPFFGIATALTVGFELNSCVLCTLLLSSVVKIGKSYLTEEEEVEYLWRLRDWTSCRTEREATVGVLGAVVPPLPSPAPPAPRRDFQRHWDSRCEGLWRTALALFLSGIPTFFAVMGLAGYLKFSTSPSTVIITAVLMAAAFVYTVALSADWAKALLVGRSASGSPLEWQAGGQWWHSSQPTAPAAAATSPSPFGFHRTPDKDCMWLPGGHVRRPYSLTLEELPYPAILGLQPWPGACHRHVAVDDGNDMAARAPAPEGAAVAATGSRPDFPEPGVGRDDAGGGVVDSDSRGPTSGMVPVLENARPGPPGSVKLALGASEPL